MTPTNSSLYAVLTTDIVHSTKLGSDDYSAVMKALKAILISHQERYQSQFEIFRGDSFQVLYPKVDEAMKASLSLRLYLQSGVDCPAVKLTQSIAIGTVDKGSESLGSSLGEAFVLSGRSLDDASRGDLTLSFGRDFVNRDLTVSTLFLQHLLNGLTKKQAEVLFYYIDFGYPEHQFIADYMKQSRQNITAHLKRSGAELVKTYLLAYKNTCLGEGQ